MCSPSAVPSTITTTPAPLSSPPASSYPSVLVGRHSNSTSEHKPKVPPPVPPRGTPKVKKGGINGKGDLEHEFDCSHGVQVHAPNYPNKFVHEYCNYRSKDLLPISISGSKNYVSKTLHNFTSRDMLRKLKKHRSHSESTLKNRKGWFQYFLKRDSRTFPCTAKYIVTNKEVVYFNPKYDNAKEHLNDEKDMKVSFESSNTLTCSSKIQNLSMQKDNNRILSGGTNEQDGEFNPRLKTITVSAIEKNCRSIEFDIEDFV